MNIKSKPCCENTCCGYGNEDGEYYPLSGNVTESCNGLTYYVGKTCKNCDPLGVIYYDHIPLGGGSFECCNCGEL